MITGAGRGALAGDERSAGLALHLAELARGRGGSEGWLWRETRWLGPGQSHLWWRLSWCEGTGWSAGLGPHHSPAGLGRFQGEGKARPGRLRTLVLGDHAWGLTQGPQVLGTHF